MKKKNVLLVSLSFLILGIAGCSNQAQTSQETTKSNVEKTTVKKNKTITESDFRKHLHVDFHGYNGIGYVVLTSNDWFSHAGGLSGISNINYLHNNQKITIPAKELMFEANFSSNKNDYKYKGPSKISYTVKGLTPPSQIPNLDNIISEITDYEKKNVGDSWTVNYEHTYIAYEGDYVGSNLVNSSQADPKNLNIFNTYSNNMEDLNEKKAVTSGFLVKKGLVIPDDTTDVQNSVEDAYGRYKESFDGKSAIISGDKKAILVK